MIEVRWGIILIIALLQISSRMWQCKNFENRQAFDKVMR